MPNLKKTLLAFLARLSASLSRRSRRRARPARGPRPSYQAIRALSPAAWRAVLSGPPAEAIIHIEAAARFGFVEAQLALAQMHLDGHGTPRDPQAAYRWFAAAASSRDRMALNMLGRCHEHGWGTRVDTASAATCYATAAAPGPDGPGLAWAQFNLAMLILRRGGEGAAGPAEAWLRRAAAQDNPKAINMLARLLEQRAATQGERAQAARLYAKAADAGDFRAQFNLATLLVQQGRTDLAAQRFRAALASGNPDVLSATVARLAGHPHPALRAIGETAKATLCQCMPIWQTPACLCRGRHDVAPSRGRRSNPVKE
jgi:TPR repeat protein